MSIKIKTRGTVAILLLCAGMLFISCDCDNGVGVDPEPKEWTSPADPNSWGMIGGTMDGDVCVANSKAMQRALDSLAAGGHTNIALEKGNYCLWGADDNTGKANKVHLPSNIALDLGGSTLRLATNHYAWTAVFRIDNEENIKVFNGTIIGDRDKHDYTTVPGSHEWGNGFRIHASRNIELYDLTVKDVTGDCIGVSYGSSNVTIRNCTISRARRGGIVATGVDSLFIHDNHIFDIYDDKWRYNSNGNVISIGAEACIAFEVDKVDGSEWITNVVISNNVLNGVVSAEKKTRPNGTARYYDSYLCLHQGTRGVIIRDNELYGDFELRYGSNVLFERNKVYSGRFCAEGATDNSSWPRSSDNVIIRNNEFINSVQKVSTLNITGGGLYDGHPDWRRGYGVRGNTFYYSEAYLVWAPLVLGAPDVVVIDNKFTADGPMHNCLYINYRPITPENIQITHYYAGNEFVGGGEIWYREKRYHHNDASFYTIKADVPPTHEDIPDYYTEVIDYAAALARYNAIMNDMKSFGTIWEGVE